MVFKTLESVPFEQIYQASAEAFADYIADVSYMTEDVLRKRAAKNGIDLSLSVGAFDDEKLVAFTLVGVDLWQEELSAFDIMTGIIKPYRGQGIARKMFDFALPEIRQRGIRNFVLEAIQENEPAVKAYQKSGFEICRNFECFVAKTENLRLNESKAIFLNINEMDKDFLNQVSVFFDWRPSWENSISSLLRIPDKLLVLGAFVDENPVGILAYYPLIRWINLLAVHPDFRQKGVASALLCHFLLNLTPETKEIKAINVDSSDLSMQSLLAKTGFEKLLSQYEMSRKI